MRMQSKIFMMSLLIGAALAPLTGQARVVVDIDVAPPAPRAVVVPPPRAGFVWAPGYWAWEGHAHVWHDGYWVRERRGYHWVGAHWEQVGPHWHYVEGYWAR